jgi:hypothetical protein
VLLAEPTVHLDCCLQLPELLRPGGQLYMVTVSENDPQGESQQDRSGDIGTSPARQQRDQG